MSDPEIAGKAPLPMQVEAGRTYSWCTCGKSSRQPLCDGSHGGTSFAPQFWTAPETKTVFFCACKHTKSGPLCDGSHGKL